MTMDYSKIKVSVSFGDVKIECDGETARTEDDFWAFAKEIEAKAKSIATNLPPQTSEAPAGQTTELGGYTTEKIADILKAKSGPKLITCAMVKLALDGKRKVTQAEIKEEMETAVGIYKEDSHGKFLGRDLGRLEERDIVIMQDNKYVLAKTELEEIKQKLSGASVPSTTKPQAKNS